MDAVKVSVISSPRRARRSRRGLTTLSSPKPAGTVSKMKPSVWLRLSKMAKSNKEWEITKGRVMESGQLNHMSCQRILSSLGARSLLGDFLGSRLLRLRQLLAQASPVSWLDSCANFSCWASISFWCSSFIAKLAAAKSEASFIRACISVDAFSISWAWSSSSTNMDSLTK